MTRISTDDDYMPQRTQRFVQKEIAFICLLVGTFQRYSTQKRNIERFCVLELFSSLCRFVKCPNVRSEFI